jgi:hypothetical protein
MFDDTAVALPEIFSSAPKGITSSICATPVEVGGTVHMFTDRVPAELSICF